MSARNFRYTSDRCAFPRNSQESWESVYFGQDRCYVLECQALSGSSMARSDLIVDLVKAGVSGDQESVRVTAEAIAANERAKKHTVVAERIDRALTAPPRPAGASPTRQGGLRVRDGSGGIQRRHPERPLISLFLAKTVQSACRELIEEQARAEVLRAHGLEPRHRVLLVGPPETARRPLPRASPSNLRCRCSPFDMTPW